MTTPAPWIPPAETTPNTGTTAALYQALRTTLLDFAEPDGKKLSDYIAQRIYVHGQPPAPTFPYITLLLRRDSTPGLNSYRESGALEVQIVGRPLDQLALVEWLGDRVDRCLLSLRLSGTELGFVSCRSRTRQTVPPFTTPADHNVVAVLSVFELWLWPRVLTSRADPSP